MPPKKRDYDMTLRNERSAKAKTAILRAARRLLIKRGAPRLSVEAVATAAKVTRPTVYNLFGSKDDLLEAVLDDVARTGEVARIPAQTFAQSDPRRALGVLVAETLRYWAHDPPLFRRLLALGFVDPQMERAVAAREARRRGPIGRVVADLARTGYLRPGWTEAAATETLAMLTSFASFDALTDPDTAILRLCGAVADLGA